MAVLAVAPSRAENRTAIGALLRSPAAAHVDAAFQAVLGARLRRRARRFLLRFRLPWLGARCRRSGRAGARVRHNAHGHGAGRGDLQTLAAIGAIELLARHVRRRLQGRLASRTTITNPLCTVVLRTRFLRHRFRQRRIHHRIRNRPCRQRSGGHAAAREEHRTGRALRRLSEHRFRNATFLPAARAHHVHEHRQLRADHRTLPCEHVNLARRGP